MQKYKNKNAKHYKIHECKIPVNKCVMNSLYAMLSPVYTRRHSAQPGYMTEWGKWKICLSHASSRVCFALNVDTVVQACLVCSGMRNKGWPH